VSPYQEIPVNDSESLRSATVQDIQLELLRRTRFNDLDGERVVASLLKHRALWTAALLDRPGVADYSQPRLLLTAGLIKLRDLPENHWNADTLFVLTPTPEDAERLGQVIEAEEWGGEVSIHRDLEESDRALGLGRQKYGLLSVWWD
jgi:hypothetical protein